MIRTILTKAPCLHKKNVYSAVIETIILYLNYVRLNDSYSSQVRDSVKNLQL